MSVGNFSAGLAKLRGAVDALRLSWNDAGEKWDDETSRALKEQHLDPLLLQLCEVVEATVPLQDVVAHTVRECEP